MLRNTVFSSLLASTAMVVVSSSYEATARTRRATRLPSAAPIASVLSRQNGRWHP